MSVSPVIGAMVSSGTPLLQRVFADAEAHRLQMLVTEVPRVGDRDRTEAAPRTVSHGFRVDAEYFYPASTIKLPIAVAALLKVEALAAAGEGITAGSPLRYHPTVRSEDAEDRDPTNLDGGAITIAHDIRKVCLVSDNHASNRLYAFVGHREAHETLWRLGLRSVRINHRLDVFGTREEHRTTGGVEWLDRAGLPCGALPPRESDLLIDNAGLAGLDIGTRHCPPGQREPVPGPMSFLHKNRVSVRDLNHLLMKVACPRAVPAARGPWLCDEHRALLAAAMGEFPRESANPRFDPSGHPDHFAKFLLPGLRKELGDTVRVINKVGRAYGFTIENALIRSPGLRCDLVVTAVIYANASGVIGADSYDDQSVADPFMADLGQALARNFGRIRP